MKFILKVLAVAELNTNKNRSFRIVSNLVSLVIDPSSLELDKSAALDVLLLSELLFHR